MRKWFLGAAALLVAYIAYPYLTLFGSTARCLPAIRRASRA
jgi:hypothetical protein